MMGMEKRGHHQRPLEYFTNFAYSKKIHFLPTAVDPKLDKVTGKYFADCAIYPETKLAQDDGV